MRKSVVFFIAAAGAAGLLTACRSAEKPAETAAQTKQETETAPETAAAEETLAQEETAGAQAAEPPREEHLHPQICDRSLYDGGDQSYPVTARYQKVTLNEEEALRYPGLAQALEAAAGEKEQSVKDTFAQLEESAAELYRADGQNTGMELSSSTASGVFRADAAVLSLREDYTDYWGGAHGYYACYGVNYEVKTGKKLEPADVITDMDAFADVVMEKLGEAYPDLEYLDSRENIREQVRDGQTLQWLLENDGLCVFFNPYDISYYAAGMQTVRIPYAEHPELFRPEYTAVPENWIQPVSLSGASGSVSTDWDGDGIAECLDVTGVTDEYGNLTSWTISLDGSALELETWGYSGETYLVKNAGHLYLYIFTHTDNDYVFLQAAKLDGGTPAPCGGDVSVSPHSVWDSAEDCRNLEPLTDPASIKLDTRLNGLSTYSGYKVYRVGADGLPESAQEWYTCIDAPEELTLLKDKTFTQVDGDGKATGKTRLDAGTALRILRTDGESWCDLTAADDAAIVRVEIQTGVWPQLVDGESAEEVFDGMMFAG